MITMEHFTSIAEGKYAAQAALIMADELKGLTPSEHPIALFTIGCSGAGKTGTLQKLAQECGKDIGKVPFKVAKMITEEKCEYQQPSGVTFDNTLTIDTSKYREQIAATELASRNLQAGVHYGKPDSPKEEKTAMAYLWHHDAATAKNIHLTGGEIARQLLIHAVGNKISCVLDSTGSGFAAGGAVEIDKQVTRPMMEAAAKANADTQFIFLRLNVSEQTALQRVEDAHQRGEKPRVELDQIRKDIAIGDQAVRELVAKTKEYGASTVILPFDEQRNLDILNVVLPNRVAVAPRDTQVGRQ